MNTQQKLARLAGIFLLLLMALVPPWQFSYKTETSDERTSDAIGYHPLWSPPAYEPAENQVDGQTRVHLIRLGIQCAAVLLILNTGIYFLRSR